MHFDPYRVRLSPDGYLFCYEILTDSYRIFSPNGEQWFDSFFRDTVTGEAMEKLSWPALIVTQL